MEEPNILIYVWSAKFSGVLRMVLVYVDVI